MLLRKIDIYQKQCGNIWVFILSFVLNTAVLPHALPDADRLKSNSFRASLSTLYHSRAPFARNIFIVTFLLKSIQLWY